MNSGVKKEGYETDLESEGKESKEMRTDFRRGCDGGPGGIERERRAAHESSIRREERTELRVD